MRRLSVLLICFSLCFTQESTIKTPDSFRSSNLINQDFKLFDLTIADTAVAWQTMEFSYCRTPHVQAILDSPLEHMYSLEDIIIKNQGNAAGRELLGISGIKALPMRELLSSWLKSLSRVRSNLPNFLSNYSITAIESVVNGGFDDTLLPDLSAWSAMPKLKSFHREEAAFFAKKEYFDKQAELLKKISFPAVYPSDSADVLKHLGELFPDIPISRGTKGDDIHKLTNDSFIILDPDGDDIYTIIGRPKPGSLRIIIDEKGDDIYRGSSRDFGYTFFSCGMIIDRAGNDLYRGGDYSISAACGGSFITWDLAGNDVYQGDQNSQAWAAMGFALLRDSGGDDRYLIGASGQALAGIAGTAVLLDEGGDDFYYARGGASDTLRYENRTMSFAQGASIGHRPFAWGGLGMLVDTKGNDLYQADNFCQGVSYWPGVGGIIDLDGNDIYTAHQYVQGSGVHLGMGFLLDRRGNDRYTSRAVSMGCGHDLSFGWFLDREGNDKAEIFDLGMGAGSVNGFGFYIDLSGRDRYLYSKTHNTRAYSHIERGFSSFGFFRDAVPPGSEAEKDGDSYNGREQSESWTCGFYGIGSDGSPRDKLDYSGNFPQGQAVAERKDLIGDTYRQVKITDKDKELFLTMADHSWANKKKRQESLEKLKADPDRFMALIKYFLDNHSPSLGSYLASYLAMFQPAYIIEAIKDLDISAVKDQKRYYRNLFYTIKSAGSDKFIPAVISFTEDAPAASKAGSLYTLAFLGGVTRKEWPEIMDYLTHTNAYVRKNAFLAFRPEGRKDMKLVRQALTKDRFFIKDAIALRLAGEGIKLEEVPDNFHGRLVAKSQTGKDLISGSLADYWKYLEAYYKVQYFKRED